jgi:bacteriorhodopsin
MLHRKNDFSPTQNRSQQFWCSFVVYAGLFFSIVLILREQKRNGKMKQYEPICDNVQYIAASIV